MKYIKTFEHITHFEDNPNGYTFIRNISELQHFDKPDDIQRILKMIDDNPKYVNYVYVNPSNRAFGTTTPICNTITDLANKPFVTTILKKLIENGADVNLIPDKTSPLYIAVTTNNLDIIKILVENNANLEQIGGSIPNATPLFLAAIRHTNGNKSAMSIMEYLIENDANWFNDEVELVNLLNDEDANKLIEKYPKQYHISLMKQKAKKYNIL